MFELFSTREIVLGIYFALIAIWVFFHKKIRSSVVDVLKVACCHQLVIPFVFMIGYATLIVYALKFLPFWKWIYLKDITMWVIFVGVPICYKAVNTEDKYYFKNMIADNFRFSVLVEFISGTFTFSFVTELILQPVLAFLLILQVVAERDDEHKPAKKLIDFLLTVIGLVILYFTIKKAITDYSHLEMIDTTVSFVAPILFSLLYLPVAYLFAVYSKYQVLFIRMGFKTPKDKNIEWMRKRKVLKVCKLSYKKIVSFEREYVKRLYVKMTDEEFDNIINCFRKATSK